MSKTLSVIIVVAVLVVGGYFFVKAKKPAEAPVVQNEGEKSGEESTGKKIAFSELVKQGGSYKCEVKQAMSDVENGGTVYMSGNNIRGDFSTVAEGKTMQSYFIMKDGYMYNWSSYAPTMGIKIKADASAQAQAEGTYTWSADQVGDYNCEQWTADEAKFALPSDVKFTLIGPQ
jgi:hypothetical protein